MVVVVFEVNMIVILLFILIGIGLTILIRLRRAARYEAWANDTQASSSAYARHMRLLCGALESCRYCEGRSNRSRMIERILDIRR